MKTALKVIGGIFATIILAIVVIYVGWLRPPSAEKVCDNVEKVTVAELKKQGVEPPESAVKELRSECEKWATKKPEFGVAVWVKELKCARDAETMEELDACNSKKKK